MVGHEASFTPPVDIPLDAFQARDIPLEQASHRALNPEELRRAKYHLAPIEKVVIGGGLEVALSSSGLKYYKAEDLPDIWRIKEAPPVLLTPIALQLPHPSTITDTNTARADQTLVAYSLLPSVDPMRRKLCVEDRGLFSPAIRLGLIPNDLDPLIDGLEIIFVSNGGVVPLEKVIKRARELARGDKVNRGYYRRLSPETIQLNHFFNGFKRTTQAESIYIDFNKPQAA